VDDLARAVCRQACQARKITVIDTDRLMKRWIFAKAQHIFIQPCDYRIRRRSRFPECRTPLFHLCCNSCKKTLARPFVLGNNIYSDIHQSCFAEQLSIPVLPASVQTSWLPLQSKPRRFRRKRMWRKIFRVLHRKITRQPKK
jgi:hypothetical protein